MLTALHCLDLHICRHFVSWRCLDRCVQMLLASTRYFSLSTNDMIRLFDSFLARFSAFCFYIYFLRSSLQLVIVSRRRHRSFVVILRACFHIRKNLSCWKIFSMKFASPYLLLSLVSAPFTLWFVSSSRLPNFRSCYAPFVNEKWFFKAVLLCFPRVCEINLNKNRG